MINTMSIAEPDTPLPRREGLAESEAPKDRTAPLHTAPTPVDTAASRGLVRSVAIAFIVTLGVLAGVLVLVDSPDWWHGLLPAAVVSALAAMASTPPIVWGLHRGVDKAVIGYFASMGARAVVSLGGCLLAVWVGGYPAMPTLLLMVVFYFVLLAVETTFVARALWSAKG